MVWFFTIGSVLLVSVVSLIGIFSFLLNERFLKKILLLLVAFSAGVLLGDSFIHLLPEAIENNPATATVGIWVLAGIMLFFVLEKIIHWRHCHNMECEAHSQQLGYMNLAGDALHNFLDGVLIAASYLSSMQVGIATTIAVLFHEIPQEIGDFGVLLHSGFGKKKAIALNFVSALLAVFGAAVTLVIGSTMNVSMILVPIAAGGFIYIAGSDLIPELHKETKTIASIVQLFAFLLGIIVMAGLLAFE